MAQFNAQREHMKAVYEIFQRFSLVDQRHYWQRTSARYKKAASQVNTITAIFAFLTGLSAALAGLMVSAYLVEGSFANGGECASLQGSRNLVTSLRSLGVIGENDTISSLENLQVTAGAGAEPIDNAAVQAAVRDLAAIKSSNCDAIQSIVNILMILAVVTPAIGGAFTTLASLYQWDRTVNIYEGALENLEVADSQSPMDEMDDITYKAALRAYVENTLRVMAEETAQWGQSVRTPPQLATFVEEEKQKAARAMRRAGPQPLQEDENDASDSAPASPSTPSTPDPTTPPLNG